MVHDLGVVKPPTEAFVFPSLEDSLDKELGRKAEGHSLGEGELLELDVFHGVQREGLVVPIGLEGRDAVHHLVDGDAEAPDIDTVVVLFPAALLRAEVGVGASHGLGFLSKGELLGEAVVTDFEVAAAVHQEVAWLDVPVDNVVLVDVADGQEDVGREEADSSGVLEAFIGNPLGEVFASGELHEEEQPSRGLVRVDESGVERVIDLLHEVPLPEDHSLMPLRLEPLPFHDLHGEELLRRRGLHRFPRHTEDSPELAFTQLIHGAQLAEPDFRPLGHAPAGEGELVALCLLARSPHGLEPRRLLSLTLCEAGGLLLPLPFLLLLLTLGLDPEGLNVRRGQEPWVRAAAVQSPALQLLLCPLHSGLVLVVVLLVGTVEEGRIDAVVVVRRVRGLAGTSPA
mmetsp:Transcript_344/g.1116  ORF Transcript_344/g.1116 Transcript_344/m.1116 type:complete len:399 (-) Transcript_344:955-2151(-)